MWTPQVKTDCKDCGHKIYHAPLYSSWVANMASKYNDINLQVFYDYTSRHYMTVIKTTPERCFMSCALTLEQIIEKQEMEKVLAWAKEEVKDIN